MSLIQNREAIAACEQAMQQHGVDMPLLRTEGPVFCEPWQAQAFAMTLALHEKGLFEWSLWAQTLSEVIKEAQQAGDPDHGNTYYDHWLHALERIVMQVGALTPEAIAHRQEAWREAAARTPHGQPIELTEQD
jgi:nitrile hydratase accessory protein